jgi:hypothetical protein
MFQSWDNPAPGKRIIYGTVGSYSNVLITDVCYCPPVSPVGRSFTCELEKLHAMLGKERDEEYLRHLRDTATIALLCGRQL